MSGFNCDDFDPEALGGFDRVLPGSVHAQVVAVDPDGGKGGAMLVDFEILRGTTPGQEGKVHQEKFADDMKKVFQKKRAALAHATGIVTMEMMKAAKAAKEMITPDWMAMLGKQVCMNLVESESDKGQKFTNLNWDEIWHPTDKKAQHVPLNAGMLKRAGIQLAADRPIDGVKQAAATAPAKTATTGEATASKPAPATADDLLAGVV
jgi:hypothetical protein